MLEMAVTRSPALVLIPVRGHVLADRRMGARDRCMTEDRGTETRIAREGLVVGAECRLLGTRTALIPAHVRGLVLPFVVRQADSLREGARQATSGEATDAAGPDRGPIPPTPVVHAAARSIRHLVRGLDHAVGLGRILRTRGTHGAEVGV